MLYRFLVISTEPARQWPPWRCTNLGVSLSVLCSALLLARLLRLACMFATAVNLSSKLSLQPAQHGTSS